ncbi:MAG: hypothetical protein E6Q32_03225 [Neisseriales bacterium]|nr:MAG: hypothetical protein E6Q32_03225 [Neisseriales bacterium]
MAKMATKFAGRLLQIKMSAKFYGRIMFLIFAVQLVVCFAYNTWFNHQWITAKPIFDSGMAIAWEALRKWKIGIAVEALNTNLDFWWQNVGWVFKKSIWVWILLPMIMTYSVLFDDKDDDEEYSRGRQYLTPDELNMLANNIKFSFAKMWKLSNLIPLGQVRLPIKEENKQTFGVGKPGSGKTNAFNQIIELIRKRKQRIIIHDYKGDYVENFYNPKTDILFNPLDERSVGWCLFNDCQSVMDIEAFGHSLIPNAITGDPFWNNAARDVLVGVLYFCWHKNKKTNLDIWRTVTAPNKVLYAMLRSVMGGEAGAKHLEDPDGKTATGVMSNLMQFVKVFDFMSKMTGNFSIREWIANDKGHGTIFITNYANLKFTLSPIISLFIQTAGNRLLSLPDDIHRRIFFFLDEFGQLPNMATIENLMTASRSKGGAVFIGVQDIGQLDKLYKKETRTTILNSASNRIVFNCKDHDTAKFFSDDIGKVEYYENMESQSLGMNKGDRINTNRQLRTENLVMPEDIQSLPDLHAFVSIGHYDITLNKWKYKKFKKQQIAFVPRQDLDLANIKDINPLEFLKRQATNTATENSTEESISSGDSPKPAKKSTAKRVTAKSKSTIGKANSRTDKPDNVDDKTNNEVDSLNNFFEDQMQE